MIESVPQAVTRTAGESSAPCRTISALSVVGGAKPAEGLGDKG